MKFYKIFVIILILTNSLLGKKSFYINNGVDTLDLESKNALIFLENYFNDFKSDTLPKFQNYWSKIDCNKYKIPDQLVYGISSDYPTYNMSDKITILYIKPTKDFIQIKTHFAWIDTLETISTLCITNHYIRKDNEGNLSFVNPIDINTRNWKKKTLRNIEFHFPNNLKFNIKNANKLILNIKKLEKEWSLSPIQIKYFYTNTNEELQKIRGFDYSLMMGNREKPSGISDDKDNIVYCGGLGENYFHEVVHIYLNKLLPNSPLREGLAMYYGGSMGMDLKWHLKRLNSYLEKNENLNLNEFEKFYYMDNFTNPKSTIFGLLCKMQIEKKGLISLKELMNQNSIEEVFKFLNVESKDINKYLRKLINNEVE
ncbi:MAG: hypothetical protein NTW25_13395 [Candidatus Kapabacteria bacterium]|nr:hypothetical protein [Candidatus Kapabacteria bacterium]